MSNIRRVVFVWNADFSIAGGLNAIKEVVSGHHTCTLCDIAYHRVTQTKEWTNYKKELARRLSAQIRQPCRNQLSQQELAVAAGDFPTILAHTKTGVIKLINRDEIDGCSGDFNCLKIKLDAAIAAHC